MNRYRSWMNRTKAPPGFHKRMMERLETAGRTRRRRPARRLGIAAAAACLALAVVLLGTQWAAIWPEGRSSPNMGVAKTPEPVSPAPAVIDETAPPAETGPSNTVAVEDPFEGQPHGDFALEGHDFPVSGAGYTAGREEPKEMFSESMTSQEILQTLGGGDAPPWSLYWAGYLLSGTAWYGGDGALWEVEIAGRTEDADEWFNLFLAPGALPMGPPPDVPAQPASSSGESTPVTAWSAPEGRSPDSPKGTYYAAFLSGGVGVVFSSASMTDADAARLRVEYVIREYAHFGTKLSLDHLSPSRIPDWRDENLTLEQARAEALGAYLPQTIPAGFDFEMAQIWAEDGTKGEHMVVRWKNGKDLLMVAVQRQPESCTRGKNDFTPEEVTPEALEKHASATILLNSGYASWSFHVDVDGLIVTYYVAPGISYEEAAAWVAQLP